MGSIILDPSSKVTQYGGFVYTLHWRMDSWSVLGSYQVTYLAIEFAVYPHYFRCTRIEPRHHGTYGGQCVLLTECAIFYVCRGIPGVCILLDAIWIRPSGVYLHICCLLRSLSLGRSSELRPLPICLVRVLGGCITGCSIIIKRPDRGAHQTIRSETGI